MGTNEDYRLYLEEKFKHLNDVLQRIETQVLKTNGRVNKLEEKQQEHPVNCPLNKKVDTIEKNLTEYNVIKKYPISFVVVLLFFAFSIYTQVKEYIHFDKQTTEQTTSKK